MCTILVDDVAQESGMRLKLKYLDPIHVHHVRPKLDVRIDTVDLALEESVRISSIPHV